MRRTSGGRGRHFFGKGRALLPRRRKLLLEQLDPRRLLAGDSGFGFEPFTRYDVNADEALTPHDALVVVNSLGSNTPASELPKADKDDEAELCIKHCGTRDFRFVLKIKGWRF